MKNQNLKTRKAEAAGNFAWKSPKSIFCSFVRANALFSVIFLLSFSVFAKDNSLKKKSSSEKESSKTVNAEKIAKSENAGSEVPESDFQNSGLDSVQDSELLEIQSELDSAVEMRSSESVAQILKNNESQENYHQVENLVLEKARNLVLTEDFELAKNISLCVIEMNIENFEAIDLYSFIEKTIANERAYKRSQILKRNRELKGAGHEIY